MVHFHLLGKELLTPFILVDVVPNEADGLLSGNLNARFSFLMVVDPKLSPPSYQGSVGIYTDKSGYVEALYLNVQSCQWVDEQSVSKGFI